MIKKQSKLKELDCNNKENKSESNPKESKLKVLDCNQILINHLFLNYLFIYHLPNLFVNLNYPLLFHTHKNKFHKLFHFYLITFQNMTLLLIR